MLFFQIHSCIFFSIALHKHAGTRIIWWVWYLAFSYSPNSDFKPFHPPILPNNYAFRWVPCRSHNTDGHRELYSTSKTIIHLLFVIDWGCRKQLLINFMESMVTSHIKNSIGDSTTNSNTEGDHHWFGTVLRLEILQLFPLLSKQSHTLPCFLPNWPKVS